MLSCSFFHCGTVFCGDVVREQGFYQKNCHSSALLTLLFCFFFFFFLFFGVFVVIYSFVVLYMYMAVFSWWETRVLVFTQTIEERRVSRDSAGNEETTVTRSLGDQSHTVTTRKNSAGEEEVVQNFANLDEGMSRKILIKYSEWSNFSIVDL